ncbi:MAG: DUF1508 domain-containing protein [Desulforhopalus sp.]
MIKRKERSQIEIRKASENEYYFVFRLPNDSIFISIFFENIVEAVAAAENIKRNSMNDNCYLPKNDTKEQSYFIFHAANKSTIGQSSIYKCRLSLEAGIRYMKKYLVDAEIFDLTT